jgi:hypothetical protein
MVGNPEVRQIPWNNDPKLVKAWEYGQTGFPWIDAIMMQLQQWGWMHHLARHSVACFLTRGDLYCHWEAGRDVFDKYLIDGDYFLNNGNWQWLSASNFFYQYFRVRMRHPLFSLHVPRQASPWKARFRLNTLFFHGVAPLVIPTIHICQGVTKGVHAMS